MNIPPEDIDRLFRDAVHQMEDTPSSTRFRQDRFWQQLQPQLEPKRTSRKVLWFRIAAGIGVFLLVTTVVWQFYLQQQQLNVYAMELNQLKSAYSKATLKLEKSNDSTYTERVVTNNVEKKDTLYIIKTTSIPLIQKQFIETPLALVDTTSLKGSDSIPQNVIKPSQMAKAHKPFRVVHANEVPRSTNYSDMQDDPSFVVKQQATDDHTPKLTITLTRKQN
ncbi:hypothetical protein [Xanthocytophaga agilis]|uniref:Uncharacterized protein n=1 Tax=Xanthocytophaga agilis TaxID=3048010 RepID=A0AAE3UIL2_9BACT|nr:hypothetical protein [Xanthocytophaga agilis]MDJ1503868.1 hypothetical protein [Xanthocytophaga agilis]